METSANGGVDGRDSGRDSDEALLARYAKTRDPSTLEAIMKSRWSEAFGLALKILRDPGAAEDAAQEAFVALVKSAATFDATRGFGGWFRTLVVNSARNVDRSRRRRTRHEEGAAKERRTATLESGEARVRASEVEAELERIPFELRAPLLLHYYEGHSHDDVAELLGCPKTTARSRIRRGLEQLRESLAAVGTPVALRALEEWFSGQPKASAGVLTPRAPSAASIEARARKNPGGARPRAPLAAKAAALAVALGIAGVAGLAIARLTDDPPGRKGATASSSGESGGASRDTTADQAGRGAVAPPASPTNAGAGADSRGAARAPSAPRGTRSGESVATARMRVALDGRLAAEKPLDAACVVIVNEAARRNPESVLAISVASVELPSAITSGISAVVAADRDGRFAVDYFSAPDELQLEGRALGYGVVRSTLSVGAVATASFGEVALGRGSRVTGRLVAADSVPIGAAVVTLSDEEGTIGGYGFSDRDGRFEIAGMAAGTWSVALGGQGLASARSFLETRVRLTKKDGHPQCRVSGAGTVELGDVVLGARVIRGRVTGTDGRAARDVIVQGALALQRGAPELSTRTDEKGEFALAVVESFERHSVWLTARSGDAVAPVVPFHFHREEAQACDLALRATGSLSGRVDAVPADLAHMKVVARSVDTADLDGRLLADAMGTPSATVGADGVYRIPGLLPGTYTVEVLVGERKRQAEEVTIVAGVEATASFSFGVTGRLTVTIANSPGRGVEVMSVPVGTMGELLGALLSDKKALRGIAEKRLGEGETEVTFDAVSAGPTTVFARLGEHFMVYKDGLTVAAGETAAVVLTMPDVKAFGVLEGRFAKDAPAFVLVCGAGCVDLERVRDGVVKAKLPAGDYRIVPFQPGSTPSLAGGTKVTVRDGETVAVALPGD